MRTANEWKALLRAVIEEHPGGDEDEQAPGHCHDVPGFWDDINDDNGIIAGQTCQWCATWFAAKEALREES